MRTIVDTKAGLLEVPLRVHQGYQEELTQSLRASKELGISLKPKRRNCVQPVDPPDDYVTGRWRHTSLTWPIGAEVFDFGSSK